MLDFGIINLSRKEKEVLFMPKENIFSGKYEPDRDMWSAYVCCRR